jgi:hypothetical protein
LKVIQSGDEAGEVTDAITIRVLKGADMQFVKDCVFVPERICSAAGFLHKGHSSLLLSPAVEDARDG